MQKSSRDCHVTFPVNSPLSSSSSPPVSSRFGGASRKSPVMAPKRKRSPNPNSLSDSEGMFSGMIVFFVNLGVQPRRLQIWKQKLEQMGAVIEDYLSENVTHVFVMNWSVLKQKFGAYPLSNFKGSILLYQWIEDSLKAGERAPEDSYIVKEDPGNGETVLRSSPSISGESNELQMKTKSASSEVSRDSEKSDATDEGSASSKNYTEVNPSELYSPPDENRNVTEIFKRMIDIYRALGDERRSFSYYKAIPVIEKLPFEIESADQIKHLPAIGKSLREHIMEIVSTGKFSKLEHFEQDEKVRTISLFGEVWGIGPATALKLYEKGHRTLDDLQTEQSLTKSQRLGLKYFDDIKTRIPRDEVAVMEKLLQEAAYELLPGVVVVCGGSYRRGKSTCGDMDIIITHPDGQSHKGFLTKFVNKLKEMRFLREDLGTDSGVDTYFGLCTFPGRELCHRIDFKVYPRDIYAFGLIAWTGNDTLNRRLRLLAESKGYRLDDTGLFPATHGSSGKRGSKATFSLHLKAEKEVFDFLGFPWLEPHDRNL
ncbi:hypothetical protein V2J09_020012 [Rumex salicifolius]